MINNMAAMTALTEVVKKIDFTKLKCFQGLNECILKSLVSYSSVETASKNKSSSTRHVHVLD